MEFFFLVFALLASVLPGSTQDPSTSSTTSGGVQYTLNFDFDTPLELCGQATINYSLSPSLSTLLPVNLTIGVAGIDGSFSTQLTSDAILGNGSWVWDPVNVAPGQYRFLADDTSNSLGISGLSDPFIVRAFEGGTTSCLSNSTASPSSTPTPQPTNNTTGSSSSTTDTSPSTSSPSETSIPASVSSSSTHVSTGLKAGLSVAGVLILLSGLTALYWFVTTRRNKKSFPTSRHNYGTSFANGGASGGGESGSGKAARGPWEGLSSVDESKVVFGLPPSKGQGPDHLGRSFSVGAGDHAVVSTVTTSSIDDHEKSPGGLSSYPPHDAISGLAYLPPAANLHDSSVSPSAVEPTFITPMVRSASASSSQSRKAPPRRIQELGDRSKANSPVAPTATSDPIRRSKGAPARKPVPSYTPEDDAISTSGGGEDPANRTSYIDPFDSRRSSSSELLPASHNNSPLATTPPTSSNLHGEVQELRHKGSFGDAKPMQHVLMPDLPPPRVASPPVGFVPRSS